MRVFYRTAAFLAASLALVCRFGAGVPAQAAVTVEDNFSRYAEGSDAGAAWDTGDMGWEVQHGALASDGADRSNAYPKTAPYARRMVVETTVRMQRPTTGEWKLAGLSVVHDGSNYWHLALVEKPDGEAKAHFVEMCEMLGGGWLANLNGGLKVVVDRGQDFNWQYDHPYRLRIELTPEGITGTVSELNGVECVRKSYAFNAKAVTNGRPSLVTSNMAANFDDFRADIAETAEAPAQPIIPAYTRLTANPVGLRGKRTGFFHVERKDGRWWVIDPAGEAFYIVGTDHVNYNGMNCEKLGYSPYHRNVAQKYGSDEKWAANATARLKQWGFNSLGAGCAISARHQGMAHTTFLSLGSAFSSVSDIVPKVHWTGFPNVFHPRFASWCERRARQICTPEREDPWLLGYFLDNELEWYGKNGSEIGMVDEVFKKPATHSAKQALIRFLRDRYPTIDAFNRAWGTTVTSYDALAATTEPLTPRNTAGLKDCHAFVRLIADRYFAATTAAIRKADPNHMILGCRFAGRAPGVWDIAGKYLDIVSVNYYGHVDIDRGISTDMPQAMTKDYAECKRPMMMTEWSFPALDAGLPCEHGAGQRVPTQKDKSRCYAIYQQKLFSLPFMVGSDYFMWVDQPALGIATTFPEDSNYGLVNEWDTAWPDLTQTATRVNPLAYVLHAGRTAELSVKINGTRQPVLRVRNAGTEAARCPLAWWIQGKENRTELELAPGASRDIPLKVEGNAFITAILDPEGSVLESDKTDNTAEKVILADNKPAVIAVNRSAAELRDVPLAVKLGKRGTNWQAVDGEGRPVPAQIDAFPGGLELALRVPVLPARSVTTFRLQPGNTPQSVKESSGDRSFATSGPLRLEHNAGSGNLLDRVLLGDLQLG
ncbi:MAG TPA: beta-galactosidase, partial [Armatimonadota bacterium]|nr:beta-galactosidase [Armatimonadota bacterium]